MWFKPTQRAGNILCTFKKTYICIFSYLEHVPERKKKKVSVFWHLLFVDLCIEDFLRQMFDLRCAEWHTFGVFIVRPQQKRRFSVLAANRWLYVKWLEIRVWAITPNLPTLGSCGVQEASCVCTEPFKIFHFMLFVKFIWKGFLIVSSPNSLCFSFLFLHKSLQLLLTPGFIILKKTAFVFITLPPFGSMQTGFWLQSRPRIKLSPTKCSVRPCGPGPLH